MKKIYSLFCFLLSLTASFGQTIYIVSSNADSGPNTLREAITQINSGTNSAPYSITFTTAGPISLTAALPDIARSCMMTGINATKTIIERNTLAVTQFRIFTSSITTNVINLKWLTIRNGRALGSSSGGGVLNQGEMVIDQCLITQNQAQGSGSGGGIYNLNGSVTVVASTISSNTASMGGGIGQIQGGTLVTTNSTIENNLAIFTAGGIASVAETSFASVYIINTVIRSNKPGFANGAGGIGIDAQPNTYPSSLSLINSTVSTNTGASTSCEVLIARQSSAYINHSTLAGNSSYTALVPTTGSTISIQNSIIANTTGEALIDNGTIISLGHNIVTSNSASLTAIGDQTNTDPLLLPLADNGGPTLTHALSCYSPAINAAATSETNTDQRGLTYLGTPDIGAYEFQGEGIPVSYTVLGSGTATCTSSPTITLTASEAGFTYQLQRNGSDSGTALTGTGSAISFGPQSLSGIYSVIATSTSGCTAVMAQSATVVSATATITTTNPTVTTGLVGSAFSRNFTATSTGTALRTFALASGTLPTGLTLTTNGVLSGTPTQSGTFSFTVRATDTNGCFNDGPAYNLTLSCPSPVYVVSTIANSGPGTLRQAMLDIAATSCPGPFTISVTTSGTINLTSLLPDITRDIAFIGLGAGSITVRRNSGSFRIFNITSNTVTVSFSGFTIADGFAVGSTAGVSGGGIYNVGRLTVANCVLRGNTATGNGGGIYNENQLTISNSLFSGNSVLGGGVGDINNGGGLYSSGGSSTLTSCSFTGNQAADGGAIYTTSSHTAMLTNCALQSNTATTYGGGIYNSGGSSTLTSCSLTSNSAIDGGGMYNENSHVTTLMNCVLQSNTATSSGGGLRNEGGNSTLMSCSLTSNWAVSGGAIRNTSNHTAILTNCVLQSNTAIGAASTLTGGGAINNFGGSSTMTSCSISSNQSIRGGGIYNYSHTIQLSNCVLQSNTSTSSGEGGGIVSFGGSSTLTSCSLTGNSSVRGGGIYNFSSHTAILTNCVLQSNTSTSQGGALFNGGARVTLMNCLLANNSAILGGAIYKTSSTATLTNCVLQSNSASNVGGGIYSDGASSATTVNVSFENNQATNQGGAVFTNSTTLVLSNVSFRGNSAGTSGTVFYINSGTTQLTNGVLFGNGLPGNSIGGTGTLQAAYSLFEQNTSGFTAHPSNFTTSTSPFAGPTGTQLAPCSPAIDRGNNAATGLTGINTDLAGNNRFYNSGTVDMGAYEFAGEGQPLNFALLGSGTATCAASPTLTLSSSETGVNYQLQRNGVDSGTALAGTGSILDFGTQPQSGTYTVVATRTGNACTALMGASATVVSATAQPSLSLSATSATFTCSILSVTLTATDGAPGSSYTFAGPGIVSQDLNAGTAVIDQSGTYSVTVTNASGCTSTTSLLISSATSLPSVLLPSVSTAVSGNSLQGGLIFTASGGAGSYSFTFGTLPPGLSVVNSTSTQRTIGDVPNQPGVFPISVTVTDGYGCSAVSAPYALTVSCPTPSLTTPNVSTAHVGQNLTAAQLIWTVSSGRSYSFDFSDLPPSLSLVSTSNNYRAVGGKSTQAGTFPISLTVTDAYGCSLVAPPFTLTVICLNLTLTIPNFSTANVGQNLTNTTLDWSAAGGTSPYSFSFSTLPSALSIVSSSSTFYRIGGVSTQPGTYPISLTVTDRYGCSAVAPPFTLTTTCPSLSLTTPGVSTALVGIALPTPLAWQVSGGSSPYSFSFSSFPPGLTTNNVFSNFYDLRGTPTQTGTYPISLTVTDKYGCSLVNGTYSLTTSCATLAISTSTNPATCGGTGSIAFATNLPNGTYSLSYVGAGSPRSIGVNGGSFVLTGLSAGSYGSFSLGYGSGACVPTLATTVVLSAPTSPTATLIANFGGTLTCAQTSITLTATGGTSYTFARTGGGGLVSQDQNAGTAVINQSGTYSVTVANASGCTSVTSLTISSNTLPPTLSVSPGSGTLTCSQTSLTLTASGNSTSYVWTSGTTGNTLPVSTSGTYSVTATGVNGCTSTTTISVQSNTATPGNPTLSANNAGIFTCNSTTLTLTASATGANLTFLFTGPGGALAGSGNTRNVTTAGTYTVIITGANGCSTSATTTLSSQTATPNATLTANFGGLLTCSQTSLTLTATGGSGFSGSPYAFSGPGLVSQNTTAGTAVVNQPGTYSVLVTNTATGCSSLTTLTVLFQNTGAISLSLQASTTGLSCSSPSALLTATPGAGNYRFSGPSLSQNGAGNTATASQAGVYSVTATQGACSATASVTLVGVPGIPPNALLLGQGNLSCTTPTLTLTAIGGSRYSFSGPQSGPTGIVSQTDGRTCIVVGNYLICNTLIPSVGTAVVNRPGTYQVVVTGENGCTATGTIVVTGTECPGGR